MIRNRLLAVAITATILATHVTHATANERRNYAERRATESRTIDGDRMESPDSEQAVSQFPDSTRTQPEAKASGRYGRKLNEMIELLNEGKAEEALALAEEVIAAERAIAYDKAVAYQIAGNAAYELEDFGKAIGYLKKAIESNALNNDAHFITMLNLASFLVMEDQQAEAVDVLERMITESRTTKPDTFAMLASAQYNAEDPTGAVESMKKALVLLSAQGKEPGDDWLKLLLAAHTDLDQQEEALKISEQLLAKNPNDKRLLLALANTYLEAGDEERALGLLQQVRAKGLLTEARDYQAVYTTLYYMEGREADVIAVVEEGLSKGILQPDLQIHNVVAQAYYYTDNTAKALEHYQAAAKLDTKGAADVNYAKVLIEVERYGEAKTVAMQALAEGIERRGDAWMAVGAAENGLGNRGAMVAAYREAAKYPETARQAQDWLNRNAR